MSAILPLYQFPGGLTLAGHKAESLRAAIQTIDVPEQLILPLRQHLGQSAQAIVRVGTRVSQGQLIARAQGKISANLHAPYAGEVLAIEPRPVPHPAAQTAPCIIIATDLNAQSLDRGLGKTAGGVDFRNHTPEQLTALIEQAGIVGLGGATFPTHVKLTSSVAKQLNTLIINAAECEPYITCDAALIREYADGIVVGIQIMLYITQAERCLVAIEDDMVQAILTLQQTLARVNDSRINLVVIPAIYPTGGEKQLIKVLTNLDVPRDGLPKDMGMLCHNVATAYAIFQAVYAGHPLTTRVVTVTGPGVRNPGNFHVYLGTPIAHLIRAAGGYSLPVTKLSMGGSMMGLPLSTDIIPVTKACNCVVVEDASVPIPQATPSERACIRCGECVYVCPASLLPQQLFWVIQGRDLDKAQEYNLFDCIECGCCNYVCPSHIPLVENYRYAKTQLLDRAEAKRNAERARARFTARNLRLDTKKRELDEKRQKKISALSTSPDAPLETRVKNPAIAEALMRIKNKIGAPTSTDDNAASSNDDSTTNHDK